MAHKILSDSEVETALKGAVGWKRNGENIARPGGDANAVVTDVERHDVVRTVQRIGRARRRDRVRRDHLLAKQFVPALSARKSPLAAAVVDFHTAGAGRRLPLHFPVPETWFCQREGRGYHCASA